MAIIVKKRNSAIKIRIQLIKKGKPGRKIFSLY